MIYAISKWKIWSFRILYNCF